jgi:GWxTD domain-containing protein
LARALVFGLLLVLVLLTDPSLARERKASRLSNPFLAPDLALWLVGPMARLADDEEIEKFLSLRDDEAAARFVEAFWARRDPDPERPGNRIQELAESRAREADRRFTEAGYRGRHTDRGTVFVLYGEPWDTGYDVTLNMRTIEVWAYPADGVVGLDGSRPDQRYRFTQQGQFTVFYDERPGLQRRR